MTTTQPRQYPAWLAAAEQAAAPNRASSRFDYEGLFIMLSTDYLSNAVHQIWTASGPAMMVDGYQFRGNGGQWTLYLGDCPLCGEGIWTMHFATLAGLGAQLARREEHMARHQCATPRLLGLLLLQMEAVVRALQLRER